MVISQSEIEEIRKDLYKRAEFVIKAFKEDLDALAEFDRTGVLKVNGKVLYVAKFNADKKDQ